MRKKKPNNNSFSSSGSNREKGRLVEQIVASMHQEPGTTIQCNVRRSPIGKGKRKREIDILITRYVCGYPVEIAIECKNEAEPIGAKEVEAFAHKLPYLGIPAQYGIYVSASGYTEGAIEVAQDARIQLLTLHDGLQDLDEAVAQAQQSTIYLLPVAKSFQIGDFADGPVAIPMPGIIFDEQGKNCGVAQDSIWQAWIRGELPSVIGELEVNFGDLIEQNVYHAVDGKLVRLASMVVRVHIIGIVLQITGKVADHQLHNVVGNMLEKEEVKAHFDLPTEGSQTLIAVETEEDLQNLIAGKAALRIVTRVRLPRINYWNAFYWPPSERVANLVVERMRAFEAGLAPDPRPFNIEELEEHSLNTIFENIQITK